jgi:hypothetical protein
LYETSFGQMVLCIRAINIECYHDGGQVASPLFPWPKESTLNQQKLLNDDTKSIMMAANQLFSSPRATL